MAQQIVLKVIAALMMCCWLSNSCAESLSNAVDFEKFNYSGKQLSKLSKSAIAQQDTFNLVATPLQQTSEGRELLKYVINCALPVGTKLEFEQDEQFYSMPGAAGIASNWLKASLTISEQRWISACVLSRVNYFGKRVLMSMRGIDETDPNLPDFLHTTEEEKLTFTVFEGGFFGNLFSENPVAYACSGDFEQSLVVKSLQDRVCSFPSGRNLPNGLPISKCGFIITGQCNDPKSRIVNGAEYKEVIVTYLRD